MFAAAIKVQGFDPFVLLPFIGFTRFLEIDQLSPDLRPLADKPANIRNECLAGRSVPIIDVLPCVEDLQFIDCRNLSVAFERNNVNAPVGSKVHISVECQEGECWRERKKKHRARTAKAKRIVAQFLYVIPISVDGRVI